MQKDLTGKIIGQGNLQWCTSSEIGSYLSLKEFSGLGSSATMQKALCLPNSIDLGTSI
jgi:hypothetical protein